jgi:hypothetical protein
MKTLEYLTSDPQTKPRFSRVMIIAIAVGCIIAILIAVGGISYYCSGIAKTTTATSIEPKEQDIQNMMAKLDLQNVKNQTQARMIAMDVLQTKGKLGATLLIYSNTDWSGSLQDSNYVSRTIDGSENRKIIFECKSDGIYSSALEKKSVSGFLFAGVAQDGQMLKSVSTTGAYGVVSFAGHCT